MPDYESGYYLASYRCSCKANYEFPFLDYGSSYFEGATVEKEYEKKIKGQPNIYDRLKCRPVLRSLMSKKNNWGWPSAASRPQFYSRLAFTASVISAIYSTRF